MSDELLGRASPEPWLSSAPDNDEEHLFTPLEQENSGLAEKLKSHYAERWLVEAGLPQHRLKDALVAIELRVAPSEEPDSGRRRLRLTSFYTGTTYWLYEWDGSIESAMEFIEDAARLQGENVKESRRRGPTPWDESPSRARKRARRTRRS